MDDQLERFVESLAIPVERKQVVLAELRDHVACAREAAVREGRDADAAERTALGELEAMRPSLERVEKGFAVSRWQAFARGVGAAVIIAVAIDQGGAWLGGVLGMALTAAIVVA